MGEGAEMLKELERQENELLTRLGKVRELITKEKLRISEQQFGVRIGSIVKTRQGIEHKVTEVNVNFGGKPWIEGNPKKKDGTFGTARRNLCSDWTLVIS